MKERFVMSEYNIPKEIVSNSTKSMGKDASGTELTVALVSDLHERNPEPVLSLLRRSQPDIICVAGDTFERNDMGKDPRHRSERSKWKQLLYNIAGICNHLVYKVFGNRNKGTKENGYRFLSEAGNIAPVFLSLGNHEWYLTAKDRAVIKDTGVKLLDNEDCRWNGIGIGGLSTEVDEKWLSKFRKKDGFKILLCHHPEYYPKYELTDFDLILSGHVHGGQWRIGERGVFAPDQGLFPKYCHGVYDEKLVISAGCSNTTAFPRFGNPCEVVLIYTKTE